MVPLIFFCPVFLLPGQIFPEVHWGFTVPFLVRDFAPFKPFFFFGSTSTFFFFFYFPLFLVISTTRVSRSLQFSRGGFIFQPKPHCSPVFSLVPNVLLFYHDDFFQRGILYMSPTLVASSSDFSFLTSSPLCANPWFPSVPCIASSAPTRVPSPRQVSH